jgi:hypothetical protein
MAVLIFRLTPKRRHDPIQNSSTERNTANEIVVVDEDNIEKWNNEKYS